jgi:hypothetical protein
MMKDMQFLPPAPNDSHTVMHINAASKQPLSLDAHKQLALANTADLTLEIDHKCALMMDAIYSTADQYQAHPPLPFVVARKPKHCYI